MPQSTTEIDGLSGHVAGATGWLGAAPDLHGKVVLVDFWTYTCINWLRSLPYLRAWSERYEEQGLVVVGVHSPEFPFEHEAGNVRRMSRELRVSYPVVLDNDFAIWRAFDNQYWPALYLVDAQGRLRHHRFGEGGYEETEAAIQQLLGEVSRQPVAVDARGIEAAADWDSLQSPENYLGLGRTERFASPGGARRDERHGYATPARLEPNAWALAGEWTLTARAAVLGAAGGRIAYRFHARDLHLVLEPGPDGPVRFEVRVDGRPPGADHGLDVEADGSGMLAEPRLHQLVRQHGPIADRTFEITFLDPGARAYAFTFG